MKRNVIFCLLVLAFQPLRSQTFEAWSQNVNWDGQTHWSEFLIFSPKYTGPNAMPVPQITNGRVSNETFLRLGGQFHTMKGDRTGSITISGGHTFLDDRVSVDFFMVLLEFFDLSDQWEIDRNVYFEHFDKKTAIGDVYINTNIQILNEERHGIDATVRIGLKTASSGLDNPARFIDSPGYYFDGSFGRDFKFGDNILRPFVMLGFYSWQTNNESLRQNDAFLYGAGYELSWSKWILSQHIRGYSGYHDIGDKPIVFRTQLSRKLGKYHLILHYQHGIRDNVYQNLGLNIQMFINQPD